MKKPFMIAEIGVNFYDTANVLGITPMEAAKKYIEAAKEAGADAVKFQSYKADTLVSKNSPAYWDLLQEPSKTQYELFIKHDSFNEDNYIQLCEFCKKIDIMFMSTPFDYKSVDYLNDLCDIFKISSSDLTNHQFIRYIAGKGKPIYLSVGASYLSEVEEAVRIIKDEGCNDICLMHCILSYPCKTEDANLNVITTLKNVFPDLKIGYSDHTVPDDTMTILTTAYLLGAEIIEKHFTLDKTLMGNDHYHAGDIKDFKRAIQNFETVIAAYGTYEKTVFPCEMESRKQARRSLVLADNVKAGEVITREKLIAKRPGTGIEPKFLDVIAGRRAKSDLLIDTILNWDMI